MSSKSKTYWCVNFMRDSEGSESGVITHSVTVKARPKDKTIHANGKVFRMVWFDTEESARQAAQIS